MRLKKYDLVAILFLLPALLVLLQTSFYFIWEYLVLSSSMIQPLSGYSGSYGYIIPIGTDWMSQNEEFNSPIQLLENDKRLGFPNSLHADIASVGMGRYSVWKGYLYFSTSDNSDPRINGRQYELYWPKPLNSAIIWMSYTVAILVLLSLGWTHRSVLQTKAVWLRFHYKLVLANLALSLFGICLALVILEIVLHFSEGLKPRYWGGNFISNEDMGWTFQRNLNRESSGFAPNNASIKIVTNSLGLRDVPEPDQIPQDTFVITIQGDSNAAGFGLQTENTLSSQLQQLLNTHPNRDSNYVVLNFGTPGYDMNQYIMQASYLSKYYKSDMSIMVFYIWNDYASILRSSYYILRPYFRSTPQGLELVKPFVPVYQQVYAHQFIEPFDEYNELIEPLNRQLFTVSPDNILSHSYLYIGTLKRFYNKGWFKQNFSQEAIDRAKMYDPHYNIWAYFPNTPQPYESYNSEVMNALFRKWADSVVNPLIILLPDPPQVCTTARQKRFSEIPFVEVNDLNFDLPTDRVAHLATQANLRVINPLEEFRQAEDALSEEGKCQLWQEDFGHLNAKGWRLLAEIIQKEIQK